MITIIIIIVVIITIIIISFINLGMLLHCALWAAPWRQRQVCSDNGETHHSELYVTPDIIIFIAFL